MKPIVETTTISPEPLSKKVVRGGMWVFALRIINRGLGFIRTIILARLLAPEDFGLLGIAMLSISTLETFSQTGFQAALIQKKENIESYLDTAWTVSALRGIILFLILFFLAPIIATFFNSPQAVLIIRVIAVSTLLTGLKNIGIIFFQKELEFNKQFYYEFSATIVDLSVAITLAFLLRNVWALVWGGIAANFIKFIMSYLLHPYRPMISFEKEKIMDLFGFGKWIVGSSIIVFLLNQGDDIFVGKIMGITALGFYQMAYTLSNLPATEISHLISHVSFPAYSKLQDKLSRLKYAYLDVLKTVLFFSFPLTGLIFIFCLDFTILFLGEKWMPIVPVMRVLVIWGLIRSTGALTGPLFQAIGRPEIGTKLQFLKLILLAIMIYPFTKQWSIIGTALAVVGNAIIANPIAHYITFKIIGYKAWDFIRVFIIPAISALFMCGIVYMIKITFYATSTLSSFIFLFFLAIFIYFVIIQLIEKYSQYDISSLLKQKAKGII